ncbi:hypothetical protein ACWV95_23530 [Streptomyces albus]
MRWLSRFTNASPDDPLVRILAERWQALTQPKRTAQYDDAVAAVKAAEAAIEQLANDRAAGLYSGAMGKHFPRLVREAEAKLETTQEQLNTLSGESRLDFAVLTNPLWARLKWRDANPELKRELVGLAIDRILVTRAPKQGARFDGWSRVVTLSGPTALTITRIPPRERVPCKTFGKGGQTLRNSQQYLTGVGITVTRFWPQVNSQAARPQARTGLSHYETCIRA